VQKVELAAQFPYLVRTPLPSRLPGHLQPVPFYGREELAHLGDVLRPRTEAGLGLKDDDFRLQGAGDLQGIPPGLEILRRGLERAVSIPQLIRYGVGEAAVCGAGGQVGDELPGLEGELEMRRGLLAPFKRRFHPGQLVKRLLYLHQGKGPIINLPCLGETATTYLELQVSTSE